MRDVRPHPASSGTIITDTDQSWRLVEACGDDIRFCPGVGWLGWTGSHWAESEPLVREHAKDVARARVLECVGTNQKELISRAMRMEDRGHIEGAMGLAQSDPRVAVRIEQLDADPYALCCRNGVVDLRTGILGPHRRELLMSHQADVAYDPLATHPALERLLATVASYAPDVPALLARLCGMSLTADCSAETLVLLQGDGGAGKTSLSDAMAAMLGDYAVKIPFETICLAKFARNAGPQPEIARMRGARFAFAAEGDQAARLDAGIVKQLTGNEMITARKLYCDPMTFRSTWTLWLVSNFEPRCESDDTGLWRRMLKLIFQPVAEALRDPGLKRALTEDLGCRSALLAWAVRGCMAWLSAGGGRLGLAVPEVVAGWTDTYRQRQDILSQWWNEGIRDDFHTDSNGNITIAALREHYEKWASDNGMTYVLGKRFAEFLTSKNLVRASNKVNGVKSKIWRGIAWGASEGLGTGGTANCRTSPTRAHEELMQKPVPSVPNSENGTAHNSSEVLNSYPEKSLPTEPDDYQAPF